MSKQSYRDLLAWQQAMDLVDDVYTCVRDFPSEELFGLTMQMRRAATSIPNNIAEGHGRFSFRDFRQFLRKARGSALELETEIMIAKRQGFICGETESALLEKAGTVGRLINGLIRNLTKRLNNREPRTKN
jgi:four helix bundle protein